jgi:glucose/arabinose dehydrogenase
MSPSLQARTSTIRRWRPGLALLLTLALIALSLSATTGLLARSRGTGALGGDAGAPEGQAAVGVAASPIAGFSETQVASGLSSPTAMAFAPDGRLFVSQQGGALRVIKNGALLATPFMTLTVNSSGERGLLGLAFDPDFATNRYLYVYYTATSPAIHNRVSRFTADVANPDVVTAGSELVILDLDNLSGATNHNGGAIHFGPDGKLYIAVGENATPSNSQTLANLLGKVLRINADGSIPTDNPFYGTASGVNRAIWAFGLRNPYTFAFRPGTGRLFINDVGQSAWEEIDDGIAGSNYGWPNSEGSSVNAGERAPIYAYGHGGGAFLGCAITGGTFYVPAVAQFPAGYTGVYFFADYCGGWINKLDPANGNAVTTFASGIAYPVDLQVGPEGNLYYLARGSGSNTGTVARIAATTSQAPQVQTNPADRTVAVGAPASFTVAASGTAPLSYQWQRNQSDIPGATAATYTLASATVGDNGAKFRAIVTNGFGSATSTEATLTVGANTAPVATITSPLLNAAYKGGQNIKYAGTGKDAQDGIEPASRFTWQIDFHHNDAPAHIHPAMLPKSGITSGSFKIPKIGETSANVFYRIILTVTDSAGLSSTTYRDIYPKTATITLRASTIGLLLTLDGQPHAAPYSFVSVVGMTRTLGVVSPQSMSGVPYTFVSWSDGKAATHTITSPGAATTYTATFKAN